MAAKKNTKGPNNTTIPTDWDYTDLGKKLDILTGFAFPSDKFSKSGIKLLRGSNVKRNQIDWKDDITRYWPYDSSLKKYELKAGDLVIALDGALIGRSFAKIKEDDLPAYLVQRVARLRGKGVDQSFLHTLFNQKSFELHVDSVKTHTAIPHISPTDIKKFKVNLPPLPEQKAIAHVLSTADAAIHTTEKLIIQKELRKKWLMQQLLTGKKRLKGFEGEWKEYHLGDMFTERNETKFYDLPLLSIGQNGVYPQDESVKKDTSNEDKSKYKRICPGDIGYNTMRMWQGRSALSELKGIVSPAYTVVTPKRNANSLFFSYLFKMPKMTNLFWRKSQGLVDDTLNCKFKDFSIVKVALPQTKEEQAVIAQVLQAADKEINLLKAMSEKLKEQKKGMMQALLTGKKRLKLI